jgi:hypothetical protein
LRTLPDPLQNGEKAAFDLRPHPSLAQNLVARLEDLPERTALSRPFSGPEPRSLKSTSQPDRFSQARFERNI